MKNLFLSILAVVGLGAASSAQQAIIPGDILVMLKPGASATTIATDLATFNGQTTELRVVKELSAPMRIWQLHYANTALPQEVMLRAVKSHQIGRAHV